jgi:cell wall-associated NlpC family hydrolase
MKNRFILLLLLTCILTGCNSVQPGFRRSDNLSDNGNANSSVKHSNPVFIENISTESASSSTSPNTVSTSPPFKKDPPLTGVSADGTDNYDELRFKYAILTNSPVEEMTNLKLLVFMDQWYGTPYHYGGSSKDGIDCSAFASLLLSDVYHVSQLPRMSADQYQSSRRISKKHLREGDLVFFHTNGKGHRVTHVGVYLCNNHFVHASIAGVQISDLGEGYYSRHFVGAGRVIVE